MNLPRNMNAHRSIVLAVTLAASLSAAAVQTASAQEAEAPPRQHWSFPGPFGLYDTGAASARLQGLSRSLLELSQPEAVGVPQSRRSGRAGLHRGAGGDDRRRLPGHRRSERQGRDVPAARQARRPFPAAVPERSGCARRESAAGCRPTCRCWPRRAATSGLPLVHLRCVHPVSGGRPRLHPRHPQRLRGSAAGRRHAAAGRAVQQIFSRPCHRHAEAAQRRAGRIYRRHAGDRGSIWPRRLPPS